VANSVTDQLQRIAVDRKTPVIHEVLLVEDEKQAYARCIGQKLNRGKEAARSALEMITIMKEVRRTNQNLRLQPSN
jgi:6,7-dimethyl-8-ribityllumazine synthase